MKFSECKSGVRSVAGEACGDDDEWEMKLERTAARIRSVENEDEKGGSEPDVRDSVYWGNNAGSVCFCCLTKM